MTDQEAPHIDRADMRKWSSQVVDLVTHLVNTEGIRYKFLDGEHIVLYAPDGVQRPFKIAAKRPGPEQVGHIERQFMRPNSIPGPDGVVPGQARGAVDDAGDSDGEWSTETTEGAQIAPRNASPREAVQALADFMGVSITIGEGVSEDDYLAVVAEKDACQHNYEALLAEAQEREQELASVLQSMRDLTKQRDDLLRRVHLLEDAVAGAADNLMKMVKS